MIVRIVFFVSKRELPSALRRARGAARHQHRHMISAALRAVILPQSAGCVRCEDSGNRIWAARLQVAKLLIQAGKRSNSLLFTT